MMPLMAQMRFRMLPEACKSSGKFMITYLIETSLSTLWLFMFFDSKTSWPSLGQGFQQKLNASTPNP